MRVQSTLFAVLGVLLCAGRAQAQMTPIEDRRENTAHVSQFGLEEWLTEHPPAPFAFFDSYLEAYVQNPDPKGSGSCAASAFQFSQFYPAGIQASGSTAGSWYGPPVGTYGGLSLACFRFQVDAVLDYQLDVWVEPGDYVGSAQFLLEAESTGVMLHDIEAGEIHVTGRLAPGIYHIEGRSSYTTSVESFQGGTYAYQFVVFSVPNPLIVGQPVSIVTPCDASAEFTVTTGPPPGTLTFQWRKNGVPLVDGSHISGATSPSLTIHDPCHPDEGYYDVLVSNGVVVEPSSVAQLEIGSTGDAGPGASVGPRVPMLALAGPSPFTRETSFRYTATGAAIAIYDMTGARVRGLAGPEAPGSGIVTWDGRTDAGTRAPAGVYFARIQSGGSSGVCRVVKLE